MHWGSRNQSAAPSSSALWSTAPVLGMQLQLCGFSQPYLCYMRRILNFLAKGILFGLEGVGGRRFYTGVVLRHCFLVPDSGNGLCIWCEAVWRESLFCSQSIYLSSLLPCSTKCLLVISHGSSAAQLAGVYACLRKGCSLCLGLYYRIVESFRFEQTHKIIKSNR